MKGTLISIFVGALSGVLLTVGANVHAARVAASRAKHDGIDLIAPAQGDSAPASAAAPPSARSPVRP
jgi:hypothetical protein